jgi:putative transposase
LCSWHAGQSRQTALSRKRPHPLQTYCQRNLIERIFCHLIDWQRIAIRYSKLAQASPPQPQFSVIVIWGT